MATLTPLTLADFDARARAAFERVFHDTEPAGEPFTPALAQRALLVDTAYVLDDDLLAALTAAARAVGDDAFYLSITELPDNADDDPDFDVRHWLVPLEQTAAYQDMDGMVSMLENALYSPQGTWGMILSNANHAVLGARDPRFIEAFFRQLGDSAESHALRFIQQWSHTFRSRGMEPLDWFPTLLIHVYGKDGANTLLRRAESEFFIP